MSNDTTKSLSGQGPVALVLSRLGDYREIRGGWEARCPAHDDARASLTISTGDDGRALIHCHARCELGAILKGLNLEMRDLFPKVNGSGHANRKPHSTIVATYNYCDETGSLLFQAVRYEPKNFKQRRPKPDGTEGWEWNLKGVPLVPYRLPELLAADPGAVVFIPEGEKDVDNIRKHGGVATCNPMGAGKWRKEFAEPLIGRHVAILPDKDGPGRKHSQSVAHSLAGKAASIKVIELPGPGKDVSDLLDAGGTLAELLAIVQAAPEWTPPAEPTVIESDSESFALTDTGLAERFAAQHSGNARYCHPWEKWMVWDGMRFCIDETGAVDRLAKETVRSIHLEAANETDQSRREAIAKFALSSESATRRAAMVRLARSETGVPILPAELDSDRFAMTCLNGTLDLKTGALRAHDRRDLSTKLCPVRYDPSATCPRWLAFLERIFAANESLIQFVQRVCGMCLSGDVSEQILFVFHGIGANGKSVLLTLLLSVLGSDYGMQAPPDLLMEKRNDAHPTERADLYGKRLVCSIETDDGRRLAESLVKQLTGGDRIRARRMHQDHFEFAPTHKIILAANHKPVVRGTDHAMWRRIRLVPFDVVIPPADQDKALTGKLQDELPGILAWAVRGCVDWQRHGLGEPTEVTAATASYRVEQDALAEFIAERCALDPDSYDRASRLFAAYRDWTGEKTANQRRFGKAMTERGFERFTNNGICYRGIRLEDSGEVTE